jgi:Kdo2-lipid IVA lauroyltransferase/acyltransferase
MSKVKYFFQFIFIIILFLIFKIIGLKNSSSLSGKLFKIIGPFFRSSYLINENIKKALPTVSLDKITKIKNEMWDNYGRIFAEYMFIREFREDESNKNITIDGQEILNKIRDKGTPVVFISGHFSNFELMAMQIEKSGINLSAIYRPLNNIFLNKLMEKIRKNFICKKQIKKGMSGIRELIKLHKKNYSTALMIDQRVTEGIKSSFFNQDAFTTTIPAQLVKKFSIPVVPIYIERFNEIKFKITVYEPINFTEDSSVKIITDRLNKILEKMILKKPEQWIWSHNRWK